MSARDELDLSEVLRSVVRPATQALLRAGELDSISLGWAAVRIPGWHPSPDDEAVGMVTHTLTTQEFAQLPWAEVVRLVVRIEAKGEPMTYEVTDAGDNAEDVDLEWHADELYSRLQDFIAESRFGWGQLRTGESR